MSMNVQVVDSIEDVLFTVQFKDDHFFEFARRGTVSYRPQVINGTVYQVPTIKHTDLIDAINEMAL